MKRDETIDDKSIAETKLTLAVPNPDPGSLQASALPTAPRKYPQLPARFPPGWFIFEAISGGNLPGSQLRVPTPAGG